MAVHVSLTLQAFLSNTSRNSCFFSAVSLSIPVIDPPPRQPVGNQDRVYSCKYLKRLRLSPQPNQKTIYIRRLPYDARPASPGDPPPVAANVAACCAPRRT